MYARGKVLSQFGTCGLTTAKVPVDMEVGLSGHRVADDPGDKGLSGVVKTNRVEQG